jgi:integrase
MKPSKPYPAFPLTPNGNGQWSKKIRGRVYYFGVWSDPQAAYSEYKRQEASLHLGIEPPPECDTLGDVVKQFLDDKAAMLKAGKIVDSSYKEYVKVCEVIKTLGDYRPIDSITPIDLKKLNHKLGRGKKDQTLSPVTHKRLLTVARMVFHFANEILDCNVKYRAALKSPEKKLLREAREAAGEKMFTAAEIRKLIKAADPHMQAVIYLGINCGFGPLDSITLPMDKVVGGFHNYARKKTGVKRRCPLWPETQKAIAKVASDTHVLNGRKWDRWLIAREFTKLCIQCDVQQIGCYSLRRTFETVAKNADVNQSVIDKIMGHERSDMSEVYNQKTFDKQLFRCTDFVRKWLGGKITL